MEKKCKKCDYIGEDFYERSGGVCKKCYRERVTLRHKTNKENPEIKKCLNCGNASKIYNKTKCFCKKCYENFLKNKYEINSRICRKCGYVGADFFPRRRICINCCKKKDHEIYRLKAKKICARDRFRRKYDSDFIKMEKKRARKYYILNRQTVLDKQKKFKAEKKEIVNEIRKNACLDCGNKFPIECMDFDHVRGEKYMEVALLVHGGASLKQVLEEIEKCDLVCSNCHRTRTKERGYFNKKKQNEINLSANKVFKSKKQKIINELKKSQCLDCKQKFSTECMDFDHVRGKKYRQIAVLVGAGHSVKKLLYEVSKCDLICSNCHRIRTKNKGYHNKDKKIEYCPRKNKKVEGE